MDFYKFQNLYDLCIDNNIPIIRQKTAELIQDIIVKNDYHSLLEIGTAYGYSCSLWLQIPQLNTIYSLEKNIDNYLIAQSYLKDYNQVKLFNVDAFEFKPDTKFDLIFVDGPKSHQNDLISRYMQYLNSKGTIVIDNLLLKKFRDIPVEKRTKNQNSLIQKLDILMDWLAHLENWDFQFIDIDDGVGILKAK